METIGKINLIVLILSLIAAVVIIIMMIKQADKSSQTRFNRNQKRNAEKAGNGHGEGIYSHG